MVVTPPPTPIHVTAGPTAGRAMTPAIAGALVVLVVAFLVSLGFVVSTGGLVLTAAAPSASAVGGVLAELETAAPTSVPTPVPTASPSPSPTPSSTPSPSPTASASPTPTPTPTPTPRPRPTSDRYAVLKPCPGTPNCYLYVIRSGNNLYSIANYFGVPLKTVQAMNPWTANGIKPGQTLRIPTPTR
jgi:LysM repeat protein